MATKLSTGITLSADFYLRNFYKNNRDATKEANRKTFSHTELSYEDSRALQRAAKGLGSFEYTEDEIAENIYSTIKAFADTYNNTMDSASESSDYDTKRYAKQLKALSQKYGEELEDIGVTVDQDGKLSVNEDMLKASSLDDIKEVLSKDSDFVKKTASISKRLNQNSYEAIFASLTGTGTQINITL